MSTILVLQCPSMILQVLGISVKADSAQVNRVYKKKMAEVRGNEIEMGRIEAAHTKIMMSGLSSRLSVGSNLRKL